MAEEIEEAVSVFKRKGSPYYVYDFIFKGRRCRGTTKLTNKIAAGRYENNLREKLAKFRAGILDPEPPPLFKAFAEQFLERTKNEMRPNTTRGYGVSLKSLKPRFGSLRLDEITADGIERFKQSRLEQKLSPSTVNRDLACLRRILLFAVKKDVIATTPFVAHKVEFLEEHRRERVLTFDEERKYLAAAGQPLRDVATVMLELGLRPGEVFAIRRHDVHLEAAPAAFVHIPAGKTPNAVRDVSITKRAREVLKRRLTAAKGDHLFPLRIGNETLAGMPRGLCYDWAQPMNELEPAHLRALRDSKIAPSFRIYDLRHTYGTRAAEAGMDVLTLQRLMGHADLKTTARYVHLSKRHLADAQTRIERHRAEREIAEAEARNAATVEAVQ
ncbi:MAG: tyrosine-type recombinase/integrase [Candidatus Acidiferrales bacterium]